MSNSKQLTQDTNFSNWMMFNFLVWVLASISLMSSLNEFLFLLPFVVLINWGSWLFFRCFKSLSYSEEGISGNDIQIAYGDIQSITETGWSLERHGRQMIFTVRYTTTNSEERKISFIPDNKELNAFLESALKANPNIQIRRHRTKLS